MGVGISLLSQKVPSKISQCSSSPCRSLSAYLVLESVKLPSLKDGVGRDVISFI
jgi:hypothetical protein